MSSSNDNQNTQPSATTRKWDDPEYRRAYFRNYHSKRNGGYKLHPYILEDGRRWKDVYEFPPEFESKEAYEKFKKERQSGYEKIKPTIIYVPKPKIKCDVCDVEVKHGKYPAHINGTQHKKNVAILEKHGLCVDVKA